jgi:hypothetical protein
MRLNKSTTTLIARSGRQTLLVGGLALLLVACGGGGGSGGGTSSSPSPTPAPSPAPSPSPAPTPSPHSVSLSWTAPATRADGTPLTASQLSGYRVYYTANGTSANADTMIPISGGSKTSATIALPAAGEYAFAITAIDQSGLESSFSDPVSVTVQ